MIIYGYLKRVLFLILKRLDSWFSFTLIDLANRACFIGKSIDLRSCPNNKRRHDNENAFVELNIILANYMPRFYLLARFSTPILD